MSNNPIGRVVKFSRENAHTIREEFDYMVEYYKYNQSALFRDLSEAEERHSNESESYSDTFARKAAEGLDNFGANEFLFNEAYLVDSLEKIKKQIDMMPADVLKNSPECDIFLYDLAAHPLETGSRLVMSVLKIDWEEFIASYYTIVN